MFGQGKASILLKDVLSKATEAQILAYYLGIQKIPCVINSPLRLDKSPSFNIFTKDGVHIHFKDFATNDYGDTFDLLGRLWHTNYNQTLQKIFEDFSHTNNKKDIKTTITQTNNINNNISHSDTELYVKVRDFKKYDIEYWNTFGISEKWLKYADVYPISHKIIKKDNQIYTFGVDKYAYAYIERKKDKVTIKIYQPFNKNGYKWISKHDGSVISLWTKIPETGNKLCICSSLKDALCLWANVGIPSIAPQGEGYSLSKTVIDNLKTRFKTIYILLDNDKPGLEYSEKLANETGFTKLILPSINNQKDISDLYKNLNNKQEFIKIIKPLFS